MTGSICPVLLEGASNSRLLPDRESKLCICIYVDGWPIKYVYAMM